MKLSKTSIIAASCLGAVALMGVGFAGWKIVATNQVGKDGNITVYNIENSSIVLSDANWGEANAGAAGVVVFGKPSTAITNTYSWLQYDTAVDDENLTPTLTLTMTDYGKSTTAPTVTATLKLDTSGFTDEDKATKATEALKNYFNCLKDNYITGPALVKNESEAYTAQDVTTSAHDETSAASSSNCVSVKVANNSTDTTTSNSKNVYTVTVTLNFGWGSHFSKGNPYTFYNAKEASTTNIDDAMTAMNAIYGLKDLQYNLTITVAPTSTSA